MFPASVLLPARCSTLGMTLARQLFVKTGVSVRLPAEPSSWSVEPLALPVLLRMESEDALASAAPVVTRTAPSLGDEPELLPVSRKTFPDSGLLPLKTSVPGPLLVKPFAPPTGRASVAVLVTAMAGEDELLLSVSALPPELVIIQFCAPKPSPHFNVPILREVSSVTVRSAVIFARLKSAV